MGDAIGVTQGAVCRLELGLVAEPRRSVLILIDQLEARVRAGEFGVEAAAALSAPAVGDSASADCAAAS